METRTDRGTFSAAHRRVYPKRAARTSRSSFSQGTAWRTPSGQQLGTRPWRIGLCIRDASTPQSFAGGYRALQSTHRTARRVPRLSTVPGLLSCPNCPTSSSTWSVSRSRVTGRLLERVRVAHPFLVRTFDPPLDATFGKDRSRPAPPRQTDRLRVRGRTLSRPASHDRRAASLEGRRREAAGKIGLAAFDFPDGTLTLTEAGTKRRASLHVVRGEAELARHDPGGLEVLDADAEHLPGRAAASTTTRSSARSPTRTSSAASATRTRTRSCTAPSSRR